MDFLDKFNNLSKLNKKKLFGVIGFAAIVSLSKILGI